MAPTAEPTMEPTAHNPDVLYKVRITLTIRGMISKSEYDSAYGELHLMLSVKTGVWVQSLLYEGSELVVAVFEVPDANGQKKLENIILDEDFVSDLNEYIISENMSSLLDMEVMAVSTPESFTETRKEPEDDSDDTNELYLIIIGFGFLPVLIILALVLSYPRKFDCTKHEENNEKQLEKSIEVLDTVA